MISAKTILILLARLIPFVAFFGAILMIISSTLNNKNWVTDSLDKELTDTQKMEKARRQDERGTFVSIISAILLNVIGTYMAYIGVKEGLIVTNYGFILGPIIGFMLDQGIGLDEGFRKFKQNQIDGLLFTFRSLISGNFLRYIVTVFLDLFLSNPLQDILKSQANEIGIVKFLQKSKGPLAKYDRFLAMNFSSILQSIVGFITFKAYTNQTRFSWAYAPKETPRDKRIPPGTIMLTTAVAGVLYLSFYKTMDYIFKREYFDINSKVMYVLIAIALLYGLNQFGSIESPVEITNDAGEKVIDGEKGMASKIPSTIRNYIGIVLFIGFFIYGLVYPISTTF